MAGVLADDDKDTASGVRESNQALRRTPVEKFRVICATRDAERRTWQKGYDERKVNAMASLDWSQCPAVESLPGKRSGAWVFRGTRTPVSTVFENLQDMSVDELVEEFGVTREQVQAVLQFAAHSTEAPTPRA